MDAELFGIYHTHYETEKTLQTAALGRMKNCHFHL